jgi:small subunit ribosomal protein S3
LGHKVHPIGFRLGIIKDWQSKWYSETHYADFVQEDNRLRERIKTKYPEAAISLIEIDRQAKDVTITLYTSRPGIVIGRGGQRVDEMRQYLEQLISKKIRLNIQEVRQPELDAYLVARSVAEQIERRVAYRRAMKQSIFRTIQAGAKGIKISCAGRLANAEIARRQTSHQGQVPLHTLRADIDYGFAEAHTTLGRIGVKVWIYKGQVLPELRIEAEEKTAAEPAPAPIVEDKSSVIREKLKKAAEETPAEEPVERPTKAAAKTTAKEAATETTAEKPAKPRAKRTTKTAETKVAEEPKAPVTGETAVPKKRRKATTKPEETKEEPASAEKKTTRSKAKEK